MKTLLKYLIGFCILMSDYKTVGQGIQVLPTFTPINDTTNLSSKEKYLFKNPSLPFYLGIYFTKRKIFESDSYQKLCISGKSYFKFSIEPNGIIKNVVAIKGTPPFLVNIFKEGIASSKEFWIFPKETPTGASTDLILPIEYNCFLGCTRGLRDEPLGIKYLYDIFEIPKFQFEDGTYLKNFHYFLETYYIDASGNY